MLVPVAMRADEEEYLSDEAVLSRMEAGRVISRAWRAHRKRALFAWLKAALRDVVCRGGVNGP